jgi:peptidyl-prolyl cis-trans isomerase C
MVHKKRSIKACILHDLLLFEYRKLMNIDILSILKNQLEPLMTRNHFCTLQIAAILIFLLISALPSASTEQQAKNEKAAIVNQYVISKKNLDQNVSIVLRKKGILKTTIDREQLNKITETTLEELINRELLFQESQRLGIHIEPQVVNQQFDLMKKMYPDKNVFSEKLSIINLSEKEMKAQVERGLTIRRLIQEKVVKRISTPEEENVAFYEKNKEQFKQPEMVRAQHIVIICKPDGTSAQKKEARKKIEKIQKRITRGEKFSALAKKFSNDPSGKNGGELGYFDQEKMVEPFSKAVFALEINGVSDIVETASGFHLIKLLDKRPERIPAYKEIKSNINQLIEQKKIATGIKSYISILRDKAKITIFLEEANTQKQG